MAVHEFHVWQLAGDRIIASAHIRCRNLSEYMKIAEQVKKFFHNEGIHSTTIQPEFIDVSLKIINSFLFLKLMNIIHYHCSIKLIAQSKRLQPKIAFWIVRKLTGLAIRPRAVVHPSRYFIENFVCFYIGP